MDLSTWDNVGSHLCVSDDTSKMDFLPKKFRKAANLASLGSPRDHVVTTALDGDKGNRW